MPIEACGATRTGMPEGDAASAYFDGKAWVAALAAPTGHAAMKLGGVDVLYQAERA